MRSEFVDNNVKALIMIFWANSFLAIALIAAALGFSGIAGTSFDVFWLLVVVVGVVLATVFGSLVRRSSAPVVRSERPRHVASGLPRRFEAGVAIRQ